MVEYGMPAETPPSSVHNDTGHPRAVLLCRPNSHPFTDRNLVLDHEVKVGRSVARAKPGPNNAIFDCKVLSRNHAVLWYSQGKFYLQDTKSSNGTFVNNQRLSKGTEESAPREVCSGDILQFGVDVMENSRQVTHGCIIATLKLYLPDGKEAKASPSIVNSSSGACIPPQDLYQLNTFIQESIAREQLLENKLLALQSIITDTEMSSKSSWKALMEEDRLLTRVEILENQLGTYSKSMSEDKLREEAKRLMEDKEKYQIAAKDSLKKLVDEKLEMVGKLQDTETKLSSLQQEYNSIHSLYNGVLQENNKLSIKISDLSDELSKVQKEVEESEEAEEKGELDNTKEIIIENRLADLEVYVQNGDSPLINGKGKVDVEGGEDDDLLNNTERHDDLLNNTERLLLTTSTSESDVEMTSSSEQAVTDQTKDISDNELRCLVKELESELQDTRELLTESRNDNTVMMQDMNNLKNKLDNAERLIESQDCLVKEMELRVKESGQIATSVTCSSSADDTSASQQQSADDDDDDDSPTSSSSQQQTTTQPQATASSQEADSSTIQDDAISISSGVSETSSSKSEDLSLLSDYSEATLKRSPSSNSTSVSSLWQACSSDPSTLADEISSKLEAEFNLRISQLEQENFLLKQQLVELQQLKMTPQVNDEIQKSELKDQTPPPEATPALDALEEGSEAAEPSADSSDAITENATTTDQQSSKDSNTQGEETSENSTESLKEEEKPDIVSSDEQTSSDKEEREIVEKKISEDEVKTSETVKEDAISEGKPAEKEGDGDVEQVDGGVDKVEQRQPHDHVQTSTDEGGDSSVCEGDTEKTEDNEKDKADAAAVNGGNALLEDKVEVLPEIPTESCTAGDSTQIPSETSDKSVLETERPEIQDIECALSEAELKIAQLLKLRESLIKVQAENIELEQSVTDLEEDIETLSVTSRYLTVFNMIPVSVLLIAIFIAFLPSLSSLMGTRDL